MSRRPTSASNIVRFNGGDPVPPPPPEKPKALPPKKVPRVRVEPAKPKPKPGQPTRGYYERRQKILTKLQTTTEALTTEERDLLREYREINEIEAAWRAKRGKR